MGHGPDPILEGRAVKFKPKALVQGNSRAVIIPNTKTYSGHLAPHSINQLAHEGLSNPLLPELLMNANG